MFRRFSSEDSELSDSAINSKSAIRVSVCMQRYFKDVRARSYIHVIRNRRVRWLEKRLQKIFSLPGTFCICANGHLLPSSEPLALLRSEESIEVIPVLEISAGTALKNNTVTLKDSNKLQSHSQNGKNVNDSPDAHCSIDDSDSVSNHSQTISEQVNYNKNLKTSNGNAGTSKLRSSDEIDGTGTKDPNNSASTINSNDPSVSGEKNLCYHTKHTAHTILQLKRRALALLDAESSVPDTAEVALEEPAPRRVRKRVRRRRRQPALGAQPGYEQAMEPEPAIGPAMELEPQLEQEPEDQPGGEIDSESRSSNTADSLSESDQRCEVEPGPVAAVARNGAARSRAPRVVRALDAHE